MRRFCSLLSLALTVLLLHPACQDEGELFEGALCIEHVSVIDAENGLRPDHTVIIRDGRIERVVASDELRLSSDNEIIDGTGKYLIPGLWDAHVHFAYEEELAPAMFRLFLAHGITSVRDTGGKIEFVKKWKDRAMEDPTTAPRVMIAGPLIDGLPNVYDGSSDSRPELSVGVGTVEEVVQLVDRLHGMGVDFVKAYEMLTPEQFTALTQRARELGLRVDGHVPLSMDVITASNAGLNSMEHLRNLEMSTAANAEELLQQRRQMLAAGKDVAGGDLRSSIHQAQRNRAVAASDPEKVAEVLAVLADNQTWQIPTLALIHFFADRNFAEPEWQANFAYLPDEVARQWRESIAQMPPQENTETAAQYASWAREMVGSMQEAGVPIMAGTDCPIAFLVPGLSLHEELAQLVRAGLTPIQAIDAATRQPAIYFGLQSELGTVAEGKIADLVLLSDSPLDDIRNTTSIEAVIRQGKHYDREALDGLLQPAGEE